MARSAGLAQAGQGQHQVELGGNPRRRGVPTGRTLGHLVDAGRSRWAYSDLANAATGATDRRPAEGDRDEGSLST